jgi:DNA-binding MarR family transcriptional regulator
LRRHVGRVDGVSGLSDAQRELVRLVSAQPGIRVGAAAAELQLASNTVSTLVTGLLTTGWILRETDPNDGRSAVLRVTPDGERRLAAWRDRRHTVLEQALQSLDPVLKSQIDSALPAMRALVERLQEME